MIRQKSRPLTNVLSQNKSHLKTQLIQFHQVLHPIQLMQTHLKWVINQVAKQLALYQALALKSSV